MLDVADTQMQNTDYFGPLVEQMESRGGREALLHHLLNRDLAGFNVRAVPQTEALAAQKGYSRRGIDQLIEIISHNGCLPNAHERFPTSH